MTTAYVIQWKWGTSRGRNTEGWTICRCYVDGVKLGTTMGGGYDLRGTAFANAMLQTFPDELLALADQANSKYTVKTVKEGRKTKKDYTRIETPHGSGLYGLTGYFDETGKALSVGMDGACGQSSMERIIEAIGYKLEYVTEDVRKLVKVAQTEREAG